jgi:predicted ATPase
VRKRETDQGPRYWMLETIREYAVERLGDSGEAEELRRRHANYFLAQAESLPRDTEVSREWLDRMETEHDNVRAALDRVLAAGDTQVALQLSGAMWRLWGVRGYHAEGMNRLEEALARDDSVTAARACALTGAVAMAVDVREYERARRYADEARCLYTDLDDAWGIGRATFFQGYVAVESGDFERAQRPLEEALTRFSALGYDFDAQLVLFNLAWAYEELGDLGRAREVGEEMLRYARTTGSARNLAFALDLTSSHTRDAGRLDDAFDAARESLRIRRDEGDIQHLLDGLSRLAAIHANASHWQRAAQLLSSSLHLHEERAILVPLYQEDRNEATLELIRSGLDEAKLASAWEQGEQLTLDEAVALALGEAGADA